MQRNNKNKTFIPSRTSPTGGERGCLCWDTNTYSIECCDGSMQAQGIGVITLNVSPTLEITGAKTITIQYNQTYIDQGAIASDGIDGNITSEIVTINGVDVNVLGSYTVVYTVTNSRGYTATATRNVTVEYTQAPILTLIGNSNVSVDYLQAYTDQGATAYSSLYGNITGSITVYNDVDTSVVRDYVVRYNVIDSSGNQATTLTRNVSISYTEIPVITLVGNSTINIVLDSVYTDAGASAISSYYGNITSSIITNNLVNTSAIGAYQVIYNVIDESGNVAVTVTRTVNVQANQSYWVTLATGFHVEPTINTTLVDGDVYNYVYLNEDNTQTTYFRYIKTDGTFDAFYTGFDGTNLTGFIVQKEIILP
tara:strand:+ start:6 stop:1106 length:1101 start_codon:yes stop_codon:yes gene_type:complete